MAASLTDAGTVLGISLRGLAARFFMRRGRNENTPQVMLAGCLFQDDGVLLCGEAQAASFFLASDLASFSMAETLSMPSTAASSRAIRSSALS